MKILPHADRLLVRRDKAPDKTDAGIHLSEGAKERPKRGIVLAVGATCAEKYPHLREGTAIYFSPYAGTEVEVPDANGKLEKLLVMAGLEPLAYEPAV